MSDADNAAGEKHARLIIKTALDLSTSMRKVGLRPADLFWLMAMIVYNTAERHFDSEVPSEDALRAILDVIARRAWVMREIGMMEALSAIKQAEAAFADVTGAGADPHSPERKSRGEA